MTVFNCPQIVRKRVSEVFPVQMNFSKRIPAGWEISEATCAGPTELDCDEPVITGSIVTVTISAGEATPPGRKDSFTVTIVAHDPEAENTDTDQTLVGVGRIVIDE